MSIIHLITTCAKGKYGETGNSVFPDDMTDINETFSEWSRGLRHRYQQHNGVTNTRSLYRGGHWQTALDICHLHPTVSLWVISAGIGLRHSSDPALPYEASFSSMGKMAPEMWNLHTRNPILPGLMASLSELLSTCNTDRFILAASPLYLNAVEQDLLEGIRQLANPASQIAIATTKAYTGILLPFVNCTNHKMMADLGANMTTLNIKHAKRLVSTLYEQTKIE